VIVIGSPETGFIAAGAAVPATTVAASNELKTLRIDVSLIS
jgi:hypothetical protein